MASQDEDIPNPLDQWSNAELLYEVARRQYAEVDRALGELHLRLPAAVGHFETVATHDSEIHRWFVKEFEEGSDTSDFPTFLAGLRVAGTLADTAKDRRAARS